MSSSVVLALLSVLAPHTADAQTADRPTRFSVTVTGQGPHVILIPGLATPGDVWEATVQHLALTHRVHVVQVAGFGGADAGPNKVDGDMLPALVAEMVQYVAGLNRPAVIGHSLGGLIALEMAAQKPDAISRVLVVDALPFFALTASPGATIDMARPMANDDAESAHGANGRAVFRERADDGGASGEIGDWAGQRHQMGRRLGSHGCRESDVRGPIRGMP